MFQNCLLVCVCTTLGVVVNGQQEGPIKDVGGVNTGRNITALCPPGWTLSHRTQTTYSPSTDNICLRINRKENSWKSAETECRRGNGFLANLESQIYVNEKPLFQQLINSGFESIWTGIHQRNEWLLWDGLRPSIVEPYYRSKKYYGWKKRGWAFDDESFPRETRSCGALVLPEPSSQELGENFQQFETQYRSQSRRRFRQKRLAIQRKTTSANNNQENNDGNKGGQDDGKMESFQKFLTKMGFKESYVDSLNENPPTASVGSKQTKNSNGQIGQEDDDIPHAVTKRSVVTTTTSKTVEKNDLLSNKTTNTLTLVGASKNTISDLSKDAPKTNQSKDKFITAERHLESLLRNGLKTNKPTENRSAVNYLNSLISSHTKSQENKNGQSESNSEPNSSKTSTIDEPILSVVDFLNETSSEEKPSNSTDSLQTAQDFAKSKITDLIVGNDTSKESLSPNIDIDQLLFSLSNESSSEADLNKTNSEQIDLISDILYKDGNDSSSSSDEQYGLNSNETASNDFNSNEIDGNGRFNSSEVSNEVITGRSDPFASFENMDLTSSEEEYLDSLRSGSDGKSSEKFNRDNIFQVLSPEKPEVKIVLSQCGVGRVSLCETEAIESLSLVGHCDKNWYGHRLLDRCYKPMAYTLSEFEAKQKCLQYGSVLATAETDFFVNLTSLMQEQFTLQGDLGPRVWVDATLNLNLPVDNFCTAMEDGILHKEDCKNKLPFICQKDSHFQGIHLHDPLHIQEKGTFVQNMTSFHLQALWCPLRMASFDDVIVWYKDGRPIQSSHRGGREYYGQVNGQLQNQLNLDLSILQRLGAGGARIAKPDMLQGEYSCQIWRRHPLHAVVSHRILLRFTNVIHMEGTFKLDQIDAKEAAVFNKMGYVTELPYTIERRLAILNKNITHAMRSQLPIVRDVITFVSKIRADSGDVEFTTYISTATGALRPAMRFDISRLYLTTVYQNMAIHEDIVREEWKMSLPLSKAVQASMIDMCGETVLFDKVTGYRATFPASTINTRVASKELCGATYAGYAWCRGDLRASAFWDTRRIVGDCFKFESHDSDDSSDNIFHHGNDNDMYDNDSDEKEQERIFGPNKPRAALLELDEIEVEEENVAEVSERLVDVLEHSDDLKEADIEAVAEVVDRIVSLKKPPSEISDKLIRTVDRVLDAPEAELLLAEERTHAPSRLINNLENFGEKVDLGPDPRMRQVTPNVAMELWNLLDSSDIVIGFGATHTPSWSAPLSDPRIVTIKDRSWANKHINNFDIAIELPENLIKNTIRYSDTSLRLSMFIYRKPGLFMKKPMGEEKTVLNSAVISASLGGRKIRGLEDKVRLVFKPFQFEDPEEVATHCVFWDTSHVGEERWSTGGCVYNGSVNGRHVCLCDHLTNFAVLMDFYGDDRKVSAIHDASLSIITLIGLSLSILGLAVTIVTFIAFKKVRQGRAQQTLFNMAIALLCFQTTFLVGVKQTSMWQICLLVAVLLHYFILVSFIWMLIEAVLQYLTFVKVLGTYISSYSVKTVLPAWGIPLVPVISVLVINYRLYLGREDYCWMDLSAFYYAFALPVGIIILFNAIMFLVILLSLVTRPKGLRTNQASSKTRDTNIKAAFTIFVLLGLTWIFGYLAIEDARLLFQYVFTILSSLQGFLIFVLMVVRRKQVRDHWYFVFCRSRGEGRSTTKRLTPTMSNLSSSFSTGNSRSLPSYSNQTYASGSDNSLVLQPSLLRRQASVTV